MTPGSDASEDEEPRGGEDSGEQQDRDPPERDGESRDGQTAERRTETAADPGEHRVDGDQADRETDTEQSDVPESVDGSRGVGRPEEQEPPEPGEQRDASDAEREEWRFSVGEVSDREAADDDEEGNVAGILMRNEPLEAGTIDPENALFFLLGSLGTILFVVLAVIGL